jgi:DNA-binding NtrC family response regulator
LQEKVLIVEDEIHARSGLTELVTSWGYRAHGAADGAEGLEQVIAWSPAIVVTDLKMPRMDGMELLRRIADLKSRGSLPEWTAVVMLTAQGSIESAVEAMRTGAWDYLPKPVDPTRLRAMLESAVKQQETETAELSAAPGIGSTPKRESALAMLVGTSPEMKAVRSLIERVASSNVSVLVTGESGTGKELVARALHDLSARRNKPFVAVNCAAIPETLIESEIFGHEKGAFTGAQERRAGCFEMAEEGTLLLDEIGEMPAGTQAKLLRVLEDRKLRRLGSKAEQPTDVRVIAATNKNPLEAVAAGELRGDLYYRLNVFNIQMPPLRAHAGDVVAIAEKMIADMNEKHGCKVTGMTNELCSRLTTYRWPGNVRELRNTIERAVVLRGEGTLTVEDLPPGFGETVSEPVAFDSDTAIHMEVGTTVDQAERQLILKTLTSTHNNKTRAAEILGISTKTLQNKLKEYRELDPSLRSL